MNDLSSRFRPGSADPQRPPTRRAQAKLRTRERVLQAAKVLFVTRGYDDATIRDIANEAGMSTGAVFANFTDKTDLFHEVIRSNLSAQLPAVSELVHHGGPIQSGLAALFSIGYASNLSQLPLVQAAASMSWASGLDGDFGDRPQCGKVLALICEMLQHAAERGELDPQADMRLLAEMLWDVYTANYRRAVFDGWGLEQLNTRMASQIDVVLGGAKLAA